MFKKRARTEAPVAAMYLPLSMFTAAGEPRLAAEGRVEGRPRRRRKREGGNSRNGNGAEEARETNYHREPISVNERRISLVDGVLQKRL